jgi:hypothetical protein
MMMVGKVCVGLWAAIGALFLFGFVFAPNEPYCITQWQIAHEAKEMEPRLRGTHDNYEQIALEDAASAHHLTGDRICGE